MNTYLIAVAGGKGLRMGGDIPKQFLPIKRETRLDAYLRSLLCIR